MLLGHRWEMRSASTSRAILQPAAIVVESHPICHSLFGEKPMNAWDDFVKSLPAKRPDPMKALANILKDAALEDAHKHSLLLHDGDGTHEIEIPEGLSEQHYHSLAPVLETDEEKAALAFGVLESLVQLLWNERDVARGLLRKKYSKDTDTDGDWLPALIVSKGFPALAGELKDELAAYRKRVKPPRLKVAVMERPQWDGYVLRFGGQEWRFRRDGGPTNMLLDELERIRWQYPVRLRELTQKQVTEAAKVLRKKTKGHIDWQAPMNRELSWSLPKNTE